MLTFIRFLLIAVLQESEAEQFTQRLNSTDDNIKFTVEAEHSNTLTFLETCKCLKDDGSTKVKVYWKVTQISILRPVF